jgi:hypothetical protein
MAPLADTYREEDDHMSVQTREADTPTAPRSSRDLFSPIERATGGILLVGGAVATAWAIPTALRYPMAVAVAVAICLIGVGVVWQKSWAATGMIGLGLLLCSSSIGYLLIQGPSLVSFAWFFVPGAYLLWVGVRTVAHGRDLARLTATSPYLMSILTTS